ncbi:unnamed protein product [Lactuca saligna]|uniref:Uncharacterized protein n=1 Tax=Lactuca saligna TaxID=75948 RepID=A0AA35ZUB1_LACSI|nr:unnamed protein product [Lactuca saligna]
MGELASNRATFRSKFELEKRHHSHSDFRSKVVKSQPKMESSTPSMEMEEIIKHMKHLPNYLENGKHDRALSFGVMDWNRLQKWQDFQTHRHEFVKTNKCSSSSSNSSSLFSTDGLSMSPQSSQSQSQTWSPSNQKVNRVTLQSHFTSSPSQDFIMNKTPETRNSNSFKSPDAKTRSISPLRRFSFSSKSTGPTERPDSPSNRAQSSPLRRLLDPIFPSKSQEDSRTKAKLKLDFKEIRVDDVVSSSSSSSSSTTRKQALFQTTIKNDRLLFTFAVENNDILAATLTSLTSSGKNNNGNSIYTFFTVHEVKKKNVKWLSHGTKSKDYGYVPNVTAQMKVLSSSKSQEFVLFSVNSNVQPQEELEAIVVKLSRNQEKFNTTVVLPGGTHGVPSKGAPSSLTDRWRSGGVCDCGGWDEGCKLKILTNHNTGAQFELFVQGEIGEKKPMLSLSPLKEEKCHEIYNSEHIVMRVFR